VSAPNNRNAETQGRYQYIREPDGSTTVKDKQTGDYKFNGSRKRAVEWVRVALQTTGDKP
jgi:hypothetical protein